MGWGEKGVGGPAFKFPQECTGVRGRTKKSQEHPAKTPRKATQDHRFGRVQTTLKYLLPATHVQPLRAVQ